MSAGPVQLPPDHPPIPTTSSADFPTVPPPACPMSSQLAATRPTPTVAAAAAATPAIANATNGNGNHYTPPYAGQVFTLGTRNSKLAMVRFPLLSPPRVETRLPRVLSPAPCGAMPCFQCTN